MTSNASPAARDSTAARHIWNEQADGVYLFNFLITREGSTEPAFEVLNQIGSPDVVE